jgi:4-alpha-glucanotransferase
MTTALQPILFRLFFVIPVCIERSAVHAKPAVCTWPEKANRILQYPGRNVRIGCSFAAGLYWMLQIDNGNVTGMMGHFEPNRPITLKEIQDRGISFELGRYCHPYIRDHVLARYFKPQDIEYIKSAYLRDAGDGKVANEKNAFPEMANGKIDHHAMNVVLDLT